jgi:perosamine synthetase
VYSFYATKNLTTGEGGMVTTNDPVVAAVCTALRHQSYAHAEYVHDRIGYNFRTTELQAAIRLVQLAKLPAITARRRRIACHCDGLVTEGAFVRPETRAGAGHVYQQYTPRLPDGGGRGRDRVREALCGAGVTTGVCYPVPVHRQPAYQRYAGSCCATAERASQDMLSIPVHHALTDAEVEAVASAVAAL